MSGFNLTELNLSGVEVSSGGGLLKPGRYIVKTSEAKLVPLASNDGSVKVEVKLTEVNGQGTFRAGLNVFNRASPKNTEIAREQLKAMLFFGGHPNPNHPGSIHTYNGLTVGVLIKEGKPYIDKNTGQQRIGSELAGFVDPSDIDPANFAAPRAPLTKVAAVGGALNDEIPF